MLHSFGQRYTTTDITDLNRSLARAKQSIGFDFYRDIFNTVQQYFISKSTGTFKYRDVVFDIWNFGEGWKGTIINAPKNKTLIMQCMNGSPKSKTFWDYSEHESENPLLSMIDDLITNIDYFDDSVKVVNED